MDWSGEFSVATRSADVIFKLMMTAAICGVVGWMVWDQLLRGGMTPWKWALLPGMLALLLFPVWA